MVSKTLTETESSEMLAKRFAELAAGWRRDCQHSSRVKDIVAHPAYQEIIAMGERAVPLILADLEKEPDHWFAALRAITGASPVVPKEHAGRMEKMAAAWNAWGREQGYR